MTAEKDWLKKFDSSDWDPTQHPALRSISPGMLDIRVMPVVRTNAPPEYIKVPCYPGQHDLLVSIGTWNMTWQSGAAWGAWRFWGRELEELPEILRRVLVGEPDDVDLRLLPWYDGHEQESFVSAYAALYQLLPLRVLRQHRLPAFGSRTWPSPPHFGSDPDLPDGTPGRLEAAFAAHVWPLLNGQSGFSSFSDHDPIRILANNLDFWVPYGEQVVRDRMLAFGRRDWPKPADERLAARLKAQHPHLNFEPPLYHSDGWRGEEEASQATTELVEVADAHGRLRDIVDCIRSNRLEDDFSARWSFEREDFERRLYRKRSKSRVTFVEINDTVPVHGPGVEYETNRLWDDLLALVDKKERHVVVLLRSGYTKVGEMAKVLGYANHSPISKKLRSIRRKAARMLGVSLPIPPTEA